MESPNIIVPLSIFPGNDMGFHSPFFDTSSEPLHISGPCLSGYGPFHQPQFPLLYSWPFLQYAMPPLIANVSPSLLSGLLDQKLIILLISAITVYLSLSLSFLLPLENNFSGLSILFVGFSLFSLLSLILGIMVGILLIGRSREVFSGPMIGPWTMIFRSASQSSLPPFK